MMTYETNNPNNTFELGVALGEKAFKGQIYRLDGDLGTGKTVFAKGFAKGLGIETHITSPTFTIVNVYEEGKIPFYHFDVYRIGDPYELEEIGYEEYFYGEGVTMIEWATLVEELMPEKVVTIVIEKDLSKGLDYRRITVEGNL